MQIVESARLCLRTWEAADWPYLRDLLMHHETMSQWPAPFDEATARAWYERSISSMAEFGFARWCCERRSDNQIIGDVGIARNVLLGESVNDLGYIIHSDYWHHGYGLEAAEAAVQWARLSGLKVLEANMAVDNLPSVSVAKKLGMSLTREFLNEKNLNKQTFWFELVL